MALDGTSIEPFLPVLQRKSVKIARFSVIFVSKKPFSHHKDKREKIAENATFKLKVCRSERSEMLSLLPNVSKFANGKVFLYSRSNIGYKMVTFCVLKTLFFL